MGAIPAQLASDLPEGVVRLGVRCLFGRWRGVLLFALPVVLVGLALLVRGLAGQDEESARHVLYGLGLVVTVPLVALLATSGLLASEVDDGSISYLLAKPVSRYTIVTSKLAVALLCVLAFARWSKFYPYPFVDVSKLGIYGLAVNVVVLTFVFLIGGLAIVAIGRWRTYALDRREA